MKSEQHTTTQPIGVETLEGRVLLAGDVTALIRGGSDLVVRGDSDDNAILIEQVDATTLRVTGLDETTVNGEESVDLPMLTDDLIVLMTQGGEDAVEIQGQLAVPGDLRADMGAGELLVEGSDGPVTIGNDLIVRTGRFGNVILRHDVQVGDDASIRSGGEVQLVSGQAEVPDFDANDFDNPLDINNPYLPYVQGAKWEYEAEEVDEDTGEVETEQIIIEVLDSTRTVLGIEVRDVRDRVFVDGLLIEDTIDFFGQDNKGNVWYFGEEVTNFEYDDDGNLISSDTEGAWQAGVNGAVPGIVMEANPQVGDRYFQEFNRNDVLDYGAVLAVDETATGPLGTFNNVVRTKDINTLDPLGLEHKLYAPGVGLVAELGLDIEDDEVEQTTELVALSLNGQPVTQLVSPNGFAGTNVGGRTVGPVHVTGDLSIRARESILLLGTTVDGTSDVRTPLELIVDESTFAGRATFLSDETMALREVEAGHVRIYGDPDDVNVLESEIEHAEVRFGRKDNELIFSDSMIGTLDAHGGPGENVFENDDSEIEELILSKFEEA